MLIARTLLSISSNLAVRNSHIAARVAGPDRKVEAIAGATAYAVLTGDEALQDVQAAAKATVEREATRVWAQEQRARYGQAGTYESAALAFGLAERQVDPEYRTRYPMWQKVLFLAHAGIHHEEAAEIIGTDALTIALELPVARAYCAT